MPFVLDEILVEIPEFFHLMRKFCHKIPRHAPCKSNYKKWFRGSLFL